MSDPELGDGTARANPLDYAVPSQRKPSWRGKGSLAVAAASLLPGLGHWIAGNRRRATQWFAVICGLSILSMLVMCLPALVPGLLVLLPLTVLLQIAHWIDAYRTGRTSARPLLVHPVARYAVAIALVAVVVFVAPLQYLVRPLVRPLVDAVLVPTPPDLNRRSQVATKGRGSMAPTIEWADRVLIHKRRDFERFSIVVVRGCDARDPAVQYIERVVGFPGETIELKDGGVSVNGKVLSPPHGAGPYVNPERGMPGNGTENHPITLGPDEYFFLGDNSPISGDSRYWTHSFEGHQPGALPRSCIVGVATWTYWPPSRWKKLY